MVRQKTGTAFYERASNKNPDKLQKNYNLEVPPLYSIIMFIEDNGTHLTEVLPSLLKQNFKSYEIILVDAGNNNITKKSFVDFEDIDKINVLNVPATTSKLTAWNKGLDVARGEYALFLTNRDFLNNDAGDKLYEVWQYSYRNFYHETGRYLSFANYEEFTPNVVCFTKYVEFDSAGEPKIKSDESFQHLNAVTEIFIEDSQKLIGLGSKYINNFLGSKFFKRKFLSDRNIKFSENNMNNGGGLLFLVESFMNTDKIIFVPQMFSGTFK